MGQVLHHASVGHKEGEGCWKHHKSRQEGQRLCAGSGDHDGITQVLQGQAGCSLGPSLQYSAAMVGRRMQQVQVQAHDDIGAGQANVLATLATFAGIVNCPTQPIT